MLLDDRAENARLPLAQNRADPVSAGDGLKHVPEAAPVVAMLQTLAEELDNGGGQRPRAEYRRYLRLASSLFETSPRRQKKDPPATPAAPTPAQPAEGEGLATVDSMASFLEGRNISPPVVVPPPPPHAELVARLDVSPIEANLATVQF